MEPRIIPNCSYDSLPYGRGGLNWYLVCASYLTFENARLIPFVISIGLVPVTWLFVRSYSNNLVGLLTISGLVLNPAFLVFDTSSAFAQTWAILFIGAFYLMKRNGILGGTAYGLSLCAKAIPIAWAPIMILTLAKTRKKSGIISIGLISIGFAVFTILNHGSIMYSGNDIKPLTWDSLNQSIMYMGIAFRWNFVILYATPFVFGLWLVFRKRRRIPDYPFILLAWSYGTMFLISLFIYDGYFPYRAIPNMIMFLFAASTLLVSYLDTIFKANENKAE